MIEEGWRQVEAGVSLIVWSRLAFWDAQNVSLAASKEADFESRAGHKGVHGRFGRLICWIAFGVGGEYLAKGIRSAIGTLIAMRRMSARSIFTWLRACSSRHSTFFSHH